MEALAVVVQHHEVAEMKRWKEENERLKRDARLSNAIQLEVASSQDIFFYFDQINDNEKHPDSITVDTLFELREFILGKSVKIMTGFVVTGECVFSTVNGHHPFMSAVLKACERYEEAVKAKGGKEHVQPIDWQWPRHQEPAMLCHNQCLHLGHMHVEDTAYRRGRYAQIQEFPTDWVSAAVQEVGSGGDEIYWTEVAIRSGRRRI